MKKNNSNFENDLYFITGYLDQCKKMNHYPAKLTEILIFLVEEIKKLKGSEKIDE